ncbi:unnamed protein product [Staurois parvus]|uniref:Uncharacterized protein n=1 Tax=Staurois parvus TaxID=386267 RepID=A0ABN9B9V2_9NEOB|nr:unnamed protein product [Staurois parvus]
MVINISFVSKGGRGLRCEWSLTYHLFPMGGRGLRCEWSLTYLLFPRVGEV